MLMKPEPFFRAVDDIVQKTNLPNRRIILMAPSGTTFNQEKCIELAQYDQLIFLCGHYEGVDARVQEYLADEVLSIGDYVLTGGELPACIIVDAVSRLIDGVLSDKECYEKESIASGLLEYPQYTRPPVFRGKEVPEVLLSGHHANIEKWRLEKSLELTRERRPDLYEKYIKEHN
jgi:tRNA (guanine37-N1)-methyltransferase